MDCFVVSLLAKTSRYASSISPRFFARVMSEASLPRCRGRRECRALDTPAALCAKVKKHTSIVTTVTPETSGIPRAVVLTTYTALSPVTGLSCHRRPRKLPSANLTPASGCQDHTPSPSTKGALVSSAARVHRIPPPTSVTIAKRPSEEAGPNRYISVSTPASSDISENQKLTRGAFPASRPHP